MSAEDTDDQIERAKLARETVLYSRWINGGRLSVSELREIRTRIGEGNFRLAMEARGVSISDSEQPPAPTRTGYERELAAYEETYGRGVRQIKRWIATGRAATPPEQPPLDDPAQMRDWWIKHMRQRVPSRILELAVNPGGVASPAAPANASINLSQLQIVEGESTRQAKQILAAAAEMLERAYATGSDADIDRAQRRWEKALNAVRLAESSDRAARKQSGDLIPKSDLFPELSQLLETLRVMRRTMSRRIRARLTLPPETDELLDAVIERERGGEESVLRRLSHFNSLHEVELQLA